MFRMTARAGLIDADRALQLSKISILKLIDPKLPAALLIYRKA
jgi:hypothetical protein